MLQTAEKAGVYGFGQSSDMHDFAPNAQLFASVNNWGPYYISQIEKAMDGSWSTGEGPDHWATWKGLSDDFLVLTDFKKHASGRSRRRSKKRETALLMEALIFSQVR